MALNSTLPKKGSLLISEPTLNDNYFNRSVVLLTEHNNEGTIGFILNKPIDINLADLLPDFDFNSLQVFFGGPVNKDNLFYIHTLGKEIEGAQHIYGDLYWGGDFSLLKDKLKLIKEHTSQVRFFIGYSGWEQEQLMHEIEANSWVVVEPLESDILSQDPKDLWRSILRGMGSDIALLSFFPENPQLN